MRGRWGVLAMLGLARLTMGLNIQVVAAVAPFLMADLDLGYGEVGTLIGVFLLPGVALAVPGGLVSRRFGDKPTLVGALVLLILGTSLLAASNGFWLSLLARIISGAGATLLTMQVAKMATDWFAGQELATAMGVLLGTFPLGIGAVMVTLPLVATATSWRVATALIAGMVLLILAVVAVFLREAPRAQASTGESGAVERPRLWTISRGEAGLMLIAGMVFSLINAGLIVFTSFTPALLVQRGLGEVEASVLTSWTSWVLIGTPPIAGYLVDRWKGVTAWLIGSAVFGALMCFALLRLEWAWLWIALFGLALAPAAVGAMALPAEVLRPDTRATGFGLFFTTNYIAFALLPGVAGYLVDLTGSREAPIWFNGLVFLAVVPLVVWFRVQQRLSSRATIHGRKD